MAFGHHILVLGFSNVAWSRGEEKVLWIEGQSKLFGGLRTAVIMLTGYES